MTRQVIIDRTIKAMLQLPDEKVQEIFDFTDFITKRYEEHLLTNGIQKLTEQSQSFDFLYDEEDVYSESDIKEVYSG